VRHFGTVLTSIKPAIFQATKNLSRKTHSSFNCW